MVLPICRNLCYRYGKITFRPVCWFWIEQLNHNTHLLGMLSFLRTFDCPVNNKWSKVRFLPGVQFESYARLVEPNKKADLDIALSKYFNTLSKGKYRVIYELGSHGRVHADFMVN